MAYGTFYFILALTGYHLGYIRIEGAPLDAFGLASQAVMDIRKDKSLFMDVANRTMPSNLWAHNQPGEKRDIPV